MGYYDFPHTRNYDTDLGYLVSKVNDMDKQVAEATEQANIATNQATIAATKASEANQSSANASQSATNAETSYQNTIAIENNLESSVNQINTNTYRINQLATIEQGSITTTADAELVDIRVGANGVTYDSAGDSVRAQYNELNTKYNTLINTDGIVPMWLQRNKEVNVNTGYIENTSKYNVLWFKTDGLKNFKINVSLLKGFETYYAYSDTLYGATTRGTGININGFANTLNGNYVAVTTSDNTLSSTSVECLFKQSNNLDTLKTDVLPYHELINKNNNVLTYGSTNFCVTNYSTGDVYYDSSSSLRLSYPIIYDESFSTIFCNYNINFAFIFSRDLVFLRTKFISGTSATIEDLSLSNGDIVFINTTNNDFIACKTSNIDTYPVLINHKAVESVSESDNWFKNKIGGGFGDSLTAITINWRPIVENNLNCTINNYGVSGCSMKGTDDTAMHQDSRINAISSDIDFLVIMGGTNDAYGNAPAPGPYSKDNTDISTFIGAYNVCLSKIFVKFGFEEIYSTVDYSGIVKLTSPKTIPIFLVTPPFQYRGDNTEVAESTAKNSYLYAEAVKEIGKNWNIPVIDLNGNCGINKATYKTYLADGVHPNIKGQTLFGNYITNGLVNNTPR